MFPNPVNPLILKILTQTYLRGALLAVQNGLDAGSGANHNGLQVSALPRGVVVARQPLELESLVRAQAGQPTLWVSEPVSPDDPVRSTFPI